ncbi:hypothetical protein ACFQT0_06665 [Hymenobacter humi]|uniref:Twin-arginine translocation signal domain-containing protein n=1 Tax=Hymenobacter humi TaxID=1411620 RepID=A0ABW2U283_9BACT
MSDNLQPRGSDDASFAQPLYTPIKRRSFFMYAGATAGATALVLAGCSKDEDNTPTNNGISLGSGDVGVLNYAYALEQARGRVLCPGSEDARYRLQGRRAGLLPAGSGPRSHSPRLL